MTDMTVRQILDAFERALDETRRKIERGEMRQDGRVDWAAWHQSWEKVTKKKASDQRYDHSADSGWDGRAV
jgi:hypothetical protein